MKSETSKHATAVGKITEFHNKIEKKKSYRIVRCLHAVVAYACLVTVLLTGGLYGYERTMLQTNTDHIEAVVSTKAEYADGEPLSFYVIADTSEHSNPVEVSSILRCDSHDGKGTYYVGSSNQYLSHDNVSSADTFSNTKIFLDSVGESASFNVKAAGIRNVINGTQSPLPYDGQLPTNTVSTCYTENTFTTSSPIFSIPFSQTKQSYPFEYVQYDYFRGRD